MNAKIIELANKANEQVGYTFKLEDAKQIHELMEKFAELLVKECANLVGGYTKENEFGTDVKEAYEEITKHFGVEE